LGGDVKRGSFEVVLNGDEFERAGDEGLGEVRG